MFPGADAISALRREISPRSFVCQGNVMQRRHQAAPPRLGNLLKPDREARCKTAPAFLHAQLLCVDLLTLTVRDGIAIAFS